MMNTYGILNIVEFIFAITMGVLLFCDRYNLRNTILRLFSIIAIIIINVIQLPMAVKLHRVDHFLTCAVIALGILDLFANLILQVRKTKETQENN